MNKYGKSDLTLKAIVVGIILSIAMAGANTYLGLKAGMTISANIPCSVIALIIFHTLLRTHSIAEVNVSQATGSVGEGIAAGVVFVFPALVLTGVFTSFANWGIKEYALILLSVLAGGILGVVLTGFLRRPMVVESKELRYPEGVATAEILKTGMSALGEGKTSGIFKVIVAFFAGVVVKLFSSGIAILQESQSFLFRAGNSIFKVGVDISAALVGVGFIIEFNGASLVAMGGGLAWLVFIPIFTAINPISGDAGEIAEQVWRGKVRFIGVGAMIVGGLWSIIQIRKQLVAGIKSAISGLYKKRSENTEDNSVSAHIVDIDLSQTTIWILIIFGFALAALAYFTSISPPAAFIATFYTLIAVFFFVAISVYIVGLIGSTNQPVSGITICTFLLAALFIFAGQIEGASAVKTILLISGVVCLSACLSGTAAQNFKTALIVGGSPRAIQSGLLAAVVLTSFIIAPAMVFLDKAFVIGSEKLRAPQASMFAAMAKGLFIEGEALPWDMVSLGIGVGILLIIIGTLLKRLKSSFGISPMAVAVGIYLPLTTTLPIFLGGLIHLFIKLKNSRTARLNTAIQNGVVICAGLVAGEAITGILIAMLIGFDLELPIPLIEFASVRNIFSIFTLIALVVFTTLGIMKNKND